MEALAAVSTSPALPSAANAHAEQKAQEFEALVLAQFLKPLFDTTNAPSLFGGDGPQQDAFSDLLHQHYADAIAERGGVGIADQVKATLINLQSENFQTQGTPQ